MRGVGRPRPPVVPGAGAPCVLVRGRGLPLGIATPARQAAGGAPRAALGTGRTPSAGGALRAGNTPGRASSSYRPAAPPRSSGGTAAARTGAVCPAGPAAGEALRRHGPAARLRAGEPAAPGGCEPPRDHPVRGAPRLLRRPGPRSADVPTSVLTTPRTGRASGFRPIDVADCGIAELRSVDTWLCPMRDPSRHGVRRPLRYLLCNASGVEHERCRCRPRGDPGKRCAWRFSPGRRAFGPRLFDFLRRASHSMPPGYSFALEYA